MLDMAAVRFEQIEQAGVCAMDIIVIGATVSGPGSQLRISGSRLVKQRTVGCTIELIKRSCSRTCSRM